MANDENQRLREEIELLRRQNNEALAEANSYKVKYDQIVQRVDEEINTRVVNAKEDNNIHSNIGSETSKNVDIEALSSIKQEAVSASAGLQELQKRWSYLDYNLNNCLYRLNRSEQYSRLNSLLLHGFPKIPKDKKHGRALKAFLLEELNKLFPDLEGGPVQPDQIEFGHTLKTRRNRKHVVIIKFSCRFTRNAIFYAKSQLPKGCGVSVSEHLTTENLQLLNEAKKGCGRQERLVLSNKNFCCSK